MIRQAALADIPRLMEIRAGVRENRLSDPSNVTSVDYAWFIDEHRIDTYVVNAGIVGFAAGDPRDGSIWALFVEPGFEGQGIGQALLAAACDALVRAGHGRATLSTEPGTRAALFYAANGWNMSGSTGSGEAVFTKRL